MCRDINVEIKCQVIAKWSWLTVAASMDAPAALFTHVLAIVKYCIVVVLQTILYWYDYHIECLLCWGITMLGYYSVGILQCWNVTMLGFYNVEIFLFWGIAILGYYDVEILQFLVVTMLGCFNVVTTLGP